jgi:hypothetical protein
MRELGRRGGQARARKAEPQDRSERLRELAWQALEELLASDTAPTAKVKAATELLDRLEPLLKRPDGDAEAGGRRVRSGNGERTGQA